MGMTIAQKIIAAHLVSGDMTPGSEVALRIDQTLTQDATGTMALHQFHHLLSYHLCRSYHLCKQLLHKLFHLLILLSCNQQP